MGGRGVVASGRYACAALLFWACASVDDQPCAKCAAAGGSSNTAGSQEIAGFSQQSAGSAGIVDSQAGAGTNSAAGLAEAGTAAVAGIGAVECDASSCDDGNPCTEDECNDSGVCQHSQREQGSSCNDGSPCTVNDICQNGICKGEPTTSTGTLTASSFAYGAELQGSDSSGGLSAFLSDDRVVFADRLDGSGTVLSVVHRRGDRLELEAQAITRTPLVREPFSGWLWQSHWVTHLLPISANRFALAELHGELVVFEVASGGISVLSRYRFPGGHAGSMMAAVVSRDGQIWACTEGIARYRIAADGSVEQRPRVSVGGGNASCVSLAVASDGKTIFASTDAGVVRWTASADDAITAEMVLPNVTGLALAADSERLLVQRVGQLDAFGPAEVYRLSDHELMASGPQTQQLVPYAIALVQGQAVVAWDQTGDAALLRSQFLGWPVSESPPTHQWPFRTRSGGLDDWTPNYEPLNVRGPNLLLQPWRRWLEYSQATQDFREITGPGHGSMRELSTLDESHALAIGPYAQQTVELTDASGVHFSAGGTDAALAMNSPLQFVLPRHWPQGTGFLARSAAVTQKEADASLTLISASESGSTDPASAHVGSGPGLLLHRGGSVYQVSPEGEASFALREFALPSSLSRAGVAELAQQREFHVSFGNDVLPVRGQLAFEVDPVRAQAVILEARLSNGTAVTGPRELLWVDWSKGDARTLARATLGEAAELSLLALSQGQLLLFDQEAAAAYRARDGGLDLVSTHSTVGHALHSVLGLDGAQRVYVSAAAGAREELLAFDFDGTLRSNFTLPAAGVSMTALGDQLLVATKASVHRLTASCGNVVPGEVSDWPVIDPAPPPDENTSCKPLAPCSVWSAPTQAGDVNRDGCVDSTDVALETACYGLHSDPCKESTLADLDGNGIVDDYPAVLKNYGKGCSTP